MYFVNCVSNPFLYSLLSQSFRTECHILLSNMVKFSPNFKKWFVKAEDYKNKGCPKKNRTRIRSYCINSVSFCGKSIKSAKSRHDENSKLVKQVYMVQQLPPGSLIRHKTFFCEN